MRRRGGRAAAGAAAGHEQARRQARSPADPDHCHCEFKVWTYWGVKDTEVEETRTEDAGKAGCDSIMHSWSAASHSDTTPTAPSQKLPKRPHILSRPGFEVWRTFGASRFRGASIAVEIWRTLWDVPVSRSLILPNERRPVCPRPHRSSSGAQGGGSGGDERNRHQKYPGQEARHRHVALRVSRGGPGNRQIGRE